MKTFLTTLIILLLAPLGYAQTTLGYTLQEGEILSIKQDAQQLITQTMDGAVHEITNNIDGILEFKVVEVYKDSFQLEMRFKDLNMIMSSSIQGELMNVSAKEVSEENPQSKMFNSLLDTPVTLILKKNGDIDDISGGDSLISKMANASGLEDEFQRNMMKKGLEKEFGSKALSESYKQMTFIYPENDVKIGDSWQNEYTGKLTAKNTWTLDDLKNDSAIISGIADIIMALEDNGANMNLEGTQQTKIITDRTSGFVRSMTVEGEAVGVATMAQLGDMEIPTTVTSTITYKLINQ